MTGRTHDLAAFSGLLVAAAILKDNLPSISLGTGLVALGANFIGGLIPDLDNSTASIWEKIRGGRIAGKIVPSILGGHRYITHSLIGLVIGGYLAQWLLQWINQILLVDMNVVWWALMIGMVSHLIMDSFTKEGVYWFFPIPWKMGFPPWKGLRLKTGGKFEKGIIFPLLLVLDAWLIKMI